MSKTNNIASKQIIVDNFLWENISKKYIALLYKIEREKYQQLSKNFNLNNFHKYLIWYEKHIDYIVELIKQNGANLKIKKFIKDFCKDK